MTAEEAHKLVIYLVEAFDPPRWSADRQQVYVDNLVDLDFDEAKLAVMQMIQTDDGEHMPRIAAVRRATVELAGGNPPTADEAWAEVLAQVSEAGRYSTPSWTHPRIATAVGTVGWLRICEAELIGVIRAQFVKVYDSLAERQVRTDALAPGFADQLEAIMARSRRSTLELAEEVRTLGG